MTEGDALRRAAERLRVLEGETLRAESAHPRAAVLGIAERIDGRRLERVEAIGTPRPASSTAEGNARGTKAAPGTGQPATRSAPGMGS